MDQVSRIYIDSRYKTAASHSDSDFRIDLPFTLEVEAGSRIAIESLMLSHVWPTVETGVNDYQFLRRYTTV